MGISPTLGTFTISYAMGTMDNASYPMVFSLLSDYFRPHDRGKIFGLVHSARPLAFLLGLFILQDLTAKVNWRVLLVSTGVIGLILGLLAILIIRDPKRGQSEPAFKSIQISGHYVFDMDLAKQTMIKPGLLLLLVFGFAATVTWNILTSGVVTYLEIYTEMSQSGIITTMVPSLLAMTIGSIMGGLVGDLASRTRKNGRILVCLLSNAFTLIAFMIALQVSPSGGGTFVAMLSAAGIFVATVYPNLAAMVVEVTLPELRSTTIAALMASQLAGSLFSPLAVEALSSQIGLQTALSRLAVSALGLGLAVLMALLFFLPGEIDHVREHLAFRGKLESRLETHK
jgi:MFS family permease